MWDWLNKLDRKCTFHEVSKSLILQTSYTTISFQPWTKSSIFCLFEEHLQEVCFWQFKADRQKFTSAISPISKTSRTWNITHMRRSNPSLSLYLLKRVKFTKSYASKVHSGVLTDFQNLLRANDLHRLRIRKLSFPKTSCHIPFSQMLDFINHET